LKVWFDILTPKQFWFFTSIEKALKEHGVEVLLTSRRYEQLTPILEDVGRSDVIVVGEFGGGSLLGKLKASVRRTAELVDIIENHSPDICVSSGSLDMTRISFGLGIPHILLSDTPESPVNRYCVPLSNYVFTPWIIPKDEWIKYGINGRRVLKYRALDPMAWLDDFRPNKRILYDLGIDEFNYVLLRMPETQASYLIGVDTEYIMLLVEKLASNLNDVKLVVLPRYGEQIARLKSLVKNAIVLDRPISDHSILYYALLFIGGGGTMTQEATLMGVPTISLYPGRLPAVHRYLIDIGALKHFKNWQSALKEISKVLKHADDVRDAQTKLANRLKRRMVNPAKVVAEWLKKSISESNA
jgi:predicted glycosyltransferase